MNIQDVRYNYGQNMDAPMNLSAFMTENKTIITPMGTFNYERFILGNKLKIGQRVIAIHKRKANMGATIYQILSFTDGEREYNTVNCMMLQHGVRSLKALESVGKEKGLHFGIVAKDLTSDDYTPNSPTFYLSNGRWAFGSGGYTVSWGLLTYNQWK